MSGARHPRPGLGRDAYGSPYEGKGDRNEQVTLFLVTNDRGASLMYGDAFEGWLWDEYEHIMETMPESSRSFIPQYSEPGHFGDSRVMALLPDATHWRKISIEVDYRLTEGSKFGKVIIRARTTMFGPAVHHHANGQPVRCEYTGYWLDQLNEQAKEGA